MACSMTPPWPGHWLGMPRTRELGLHDFALPGWEARRPAYLLVTAQWEMETLELLQWEPSFWPRYQTCLLFSSAPWCHRNSPDSAHPSAALALSPEPLCWKLWRCSSFWKNLDSESFANVRERNPTIHFGSVRLLSEPSALQERFSWLRSKACKMKRSWLFCSNNMPPEGLRECGAPPPSHSETKSGTHLKMNGESFADKELQTLTLDSNPTKTRGMPHPCLNPSTYISNGLVMAPFRHTTTLASLKSNLSLIISNKIPHYTHLQHSPQTKNSSLFVISLSTIQLNNPIYSASYNQSLLSCHWCPSKVQVY